MSAEVTKARSHVTFTPKDTDEIVGHMLVGVNVMRYCVTDIIGGLGGSTQGEGWRHIEPFPGNLAEAPCWVQRCDRGWQWL